MTDDEKDLIENHLLFNKLFQSLEDCDSKKVDDFKQELEDSVVYIINLKGLK